MVFYAVCLNRFFTYEMQVFGFKTKGLGFENKSFSLLAFGITGYYFYYVIKTNRNMKIAVYQIETVTPQHNSDEYFEILDILNLPSLKHGTAEFCGKFSHWTTKSELKTMSKVSAKFYDRGYEVWRDGLLLMNLNEGNKMFAQYAGNL